MVNNVYVSAVTTDNVSRNELVAWVNALLQAQLSKIEEMSTGAAYCQLTHIIFPDSIGLKKVKWNSKSEMDHINNWKILGLAWKDIGVDKPVQVEKLVKGKFQDNYEFLQWFYKFFNANGEGIDFSSYEALAHRGGEAFPAGAKGPAGRAALAPRAPAPPRQAPAALAKKATPAAPSPASTGAPARTSAAPAAASTGSNAADKAKIRELEEQIQEHYEALQTAEKERDFYFNKLRAVEDLCNAAPEGQSVNSQKILDILYAPDDIPLENEEGVENVAPADEPTPVAAEAHENLDDSETF